MDAPLVTIGVISYNRLLYLRALLASARECIEHPRIQWIVVDGGSTEPGLRDYLESLDFVDDLVVERCTHAEAMNIVVERARGACLMLLPEDAQFIVRGPWLQDLAELVLRDEHIGHVWFHVSARRTLRRYFVDRSVTVRGRRVRIPFARRHPAVYRTTSGREFLGFGSTRSGINASGLLTFGRTEIWRTLGPWRTTRAPALMNDSSLGAEDEMAARYAGSGLQLEAVQLRYPVAADIVTDPRGTKARVRAGDRRYGRYAPPAPGGRYYRVFDDGELAQRFAHVLPAPGFEDVVEPIGFALPLDARGNVLKADVIDDGEPYELVHAARA